VALIDREPLSLLMFTCRNACYPQEKKQKGEAVVNKCLRITLTAEPREYLLYTVIQQQARQRNLEGLTQQISRDKIKIVICGRKEDVDSFVDYLHSQAHHEHIEFIEIEPFLKDKDYRGVFRVIE
jgi:acylphosphatase